MAVSTFEEERARDKTKRQEAIDQAYGVSKAKRGRIGAIEKGTQAAIRAGRRRGGQVVASAVDPSRSGASFGSMAQLALERGAQEGMQEAQGAERVAEARVGAEEAQLEAMRFEQEATPSAKQEMRDLTADAENFKQLDKTDTEKAQYVLNLAMTAESDAVFKALLSDASRLDGDLVLQAQRSSPHLLDRLGRTSPAQREVDNEDLG